jgi:hypothetical protein
VVLFSLASRYDKISGLDTREHECIGRKIIIIPDVRKPQFQTAAYEGAKKKKPG